MRLPVTRQSSLLLHLLCLLLLAVPLAFAQGDRATVTGTVTDPTGAAVAGATVRVIQTTTNFERNTTTSDSGAYTIPQLPVGPYRVEISASGFKTLVNNEVVLTAGATVRVDGALETGNVTEQVNVKAEAALLQTDSVKVATAVTPKFVQDLPLVVGGQLRSPIDLALITPEAKTGRDGDRAAGNVIIGGGQEGGWDLTVDGVSATPGAPFEQRLWTIINSPSVEAITEFSIETNGFKAEFGHAGGGLISFVSKSGGNDYHGNVYEFLRNEFFDANNYFNNAFGRPRPKLRQHDFGFTIGGPVWLPKKIFGPAGYNGRDRSFFFVSYEGFRNREGAAVSRLTVPLEEMYQGDFRNWRDANGNIIPIYDPATTRPNPSGSGFIRDQFQCNGVLNVICPNRFSQVTRNVLPLATMRPNVFDANGRPLTRNNYIAPATSQSAPWNKLDVKGDQVIGTKDRIGFLYHWAETLVVPLGTPQGNGLPEPLNNFRDEDSHTKVYRWNWDHTFSPTITNRLNVGYNDWFQIRASQNRDKGWGTKIGIKNAPLPDLLFPGLDIGQYTGWGRAEWGGSANKSFAISDDLNWVRGRHSLKFGFIFQEDHYNGYGAHTGAGSFTFGRSVTAFPGDQSENSGNGFASFLLGEVTAANIETLRYVSDQWRYFGGYAQDDWRVNNRLTLNYGLRYDYTPPTVEGHYPNGYSNFDPNVPNPGADNRLGAMVFAGKGQGRTGTRSLYPPWRWGFGPRFGLAWSVNDKTVVRASAARSFAGIKNTGGSSHFQGFFQNTGFGSASLPASSIFNWDNGLPSWPQPPFLLPTLQNERDVNYWQPYDAGRLPEYYNLSLNIQREIVGNLLFEVGYSGVLGHHLTTNLVNINQVNPQHFYDLVARYRGEGHADPVRAARDLLNSNINAAEAVRLGFRKPYTSFNRSVADSLRPYPQYNTINTGGDGGDRSGNSTYHALILKLEKRYSSGLTFLHSYVFSKALNDAEAANAGGNSGMDQYNRRANKAISRSDQTHQFKFNYSYELPFGKGKRYLSEGALGHIIGGWRVAAIHQYASGLPLEVGPGYSFLPTAGNRLTVVDYEGWRAPIRGEKFDPFADRWFNCAAFQRVQDRVTDPVLNACGQPSSGNVKAFVARDRFGTGTSRNPKERSPWFLTENISVARTFVFTEKLRADFRWEAFNLLNRVRWGNPNTNINDAANFGLITTQGNTPRQMQFGIKVEF